VSLANARALVIGASRYQHVRVLPPVADARDLAGVLRDPLVCGYDPANVALVQEADATRVRILDELDQLAARSERDSTALVYFSGHGGRLPGDAGESYLMPIDGEWSSADRLDATAISSSVFGKKLAAIQAERLTVILDCCHAAALAQPRDMSDDTWNPEFGDDALGRIAGRGRVVMAASRGDGSSYVLNGASYGLFTEHLIAGLRGAAAGADGLVRVLDLYHHAQRNVVARFRDQRPVLKAELEDNYPLARGHVSAPVVDARPSDFAYDVLVVYAPEDRDRGWATSTLIRLLEEQGVRVCVEDRDAQLGQSRLLELERLVATSRFTLPVLTRAFSAGRLQQLQTLMAQQLGIESGTARLIPIVREACDARLALRMLVPLDMIRDENVASGVDRLVRTLRQVRTGS
jgi:Caspase domain/TIR domain